MADPSMLLNHRRELAAGMHEVYAIFDRVDALAVSQGAQESLRAGTNRLIELVVAEELRVRKTAWVSINKVLALDPGRVGPALNGLASAVAAALPNRRVALLVLDGFGDWIAAAEPDLAAVFLETLPKLMPSLAGMAPSGVARVLASARGLPDAAAGVALLRQVAHYGATTARIVLAMAELAHRALAWNRAEYLERVRGTMAPESLCNSRDSLQLVPMVAKVSECSAQRNREAWYKSLELLFSLAERNHSSAYCVAKNLLALVPKLSEAHLICYLDDFRTLVTSVGIRLVGFGLRELPGFYDRYGVERSKDFVGLVEAVAGAYGPSAGERFCSRRTAAARAALPA